MSSLSNAGPRIREIKFDCPRSMGPVALSLGAVLSGRHFAFSLRNNLQGADHPWTGNFVNFLFFPFSTRLCLLASVHSKRLTYPRTRCAMRTTHTYTHPMGPQIPMCPTFGVLWYYGVARQVLGDWATGRLGEQGVNLGGPFLWKVAEGCTHFC